MAFAAGLILALFSEALTPIVGLGFLALWFYQRKRRYLWSLAGVVAGTLIVILSPGNGIRAAAQERLPLPILFLGLAQNIGHYVVWVFIHQPSGAILALLVGLLCPPKTRPRNRVRVVLILASIVIIVMVISMSVPIFATSALAPRQYSPAAAAITLASFIVGSLWSRISSRPSSS